MTSFDGTEESLPVLLRLQLILHVVNIGVAFLYTKSSWIKSIGCKQIFEEKLRTNIVIKYMQVSNAKILWGVFHEYKYWVHTFCLFPETLRNWDKEIKVFLHRVQQNGLSWPGAKVVEKVCIHLRQMSIPRKADSYVWQVHSTSFDSYWDARVKLGLAQNARAHSSSHKR